MKLIKQSFEILEQKDFTLKGIKQFIERCGRVCYKSEDRITDTSYEKFVGMLESRDHSRPLEFGTVHLKMPYGIFNYIAGLCISRGFWNSYWIKHNIDFNSHKDFSNKDMYITTNYRYYKALRTLNSLCHIDVENFLDENDNPLYPKRYTVHMILSRGVMDEFRTHVGLSHLAESTRYCNYSKDKFDNQITFVIPNWCSIKPKDNISTRDIYFGKDFDEETPEYIWLNALNCTEITYKNLLKGGLTPQQAREVLPLGIKSELISCGFEDAWENFFYRRCAKDAHPMAREIAIPMQEKFRELCYIGYVDK